VRLGDVDYRLTVSHVLTTRSWRTKTGIDSSRGAVDVAFTVLRPTALLQRPTVGERRATNSFT